MNKKWTKSIKKKPPKQAIITREQVNSSMEDFLKRGGRITRITNRGIAATQCYDVFEQDEACNFLIGD